MAKINKLTQAQIAKFPHYVSEWMSHGLSTEPANRKLAESAIRRMYSGAALTEPRIIWADSPLSGALIIYALRKGVGASVRDSVGASVRDSVRDSVWDSVRASVRDSVRDSVWDSVWASVRDSVWASVWDSVRDSVWDSVRDSVWGQHESHWLGFHDFFRNECGLAEQTLKALPLTDLAKSCGWIFPYESICIATERHNVCLTDDAGLVHCETGPAIAYKDGFEIYAWHGTRLPEKWVKERDSIDPSEILKCEDVERRAAGAAMVGWPRMLDHLKHEIVDAGPSSDWGDLLRVWMPDLQEPALMLKAECPRNGTICEFVPDEGRSIDGRTYPVDSVVAAQASRVFKHPDNYQHPQRRT